MTKRISLALAAGALLAATPAAAQQPVTTYPATSAPVFTTQTFGATTYGSSTVITADESATTRRGLFARIRARREARSMPATTTTYGPTVGSFGSSVYTPTVTTPGTIFTPTPTTTIPTAPPPAVPMQMPGKMSMMTPTGMQLVTVNGTTYAVPATLPPEGVVVSERIITPTTGMLDRNVIWPASGTMTTMPGQIQNLTFRYVGPTVVVPAPGAVTPATFTVPLQPMPMPMPRERDR